MIVYVYDIKTLQIIASPYAKEYKVFKEKPNDFYPDWDKENHLGSSIMFQNPIIINNQIREKTRQELILIDGKLSLLQPGEYIENGNLIKIEAPKEFLKPIWDKELRTWYESATLEEYEETLRKEITNKTTDLLKIQAAGFGNIELEEEIKILREKHMKITHELALREE